MKRMAGSPSTWLGLLALALGLAGCTPPPETPPAPDGRYRNPSSWLCLPGRSDACTGDLTATAIRADGSRVVEPFAPAADPKADCFYVYPTVDLSLVPKNHDDFSSVEPMAKTAMAQVARFRQSCALYAPLYRQVSIGTYIASKSWQERALAFAYADVAASFAEYLTRYNRGRPIVILGHSQGTEMVVRLVRQFFDADPALRARLVVVLAIGGDVEAPKGQRQGGTFAHVPLCTGDLELGCVVAFHSYDRNQNVDAGRAAPRPGNVSVCVNPADIDRNALRPLAAAYLPADGRMRSTVKGWDGIATPFVVLRDFYAAQCATNEDGFEYLAISLAKLPGDARPNPFDLASLPLRKALGLHILDYQLPQGDLLDLVAKRVERLP
jgi:hypothetical protein